MGQSDWNLGNNMVFLFQRKPDTPTNGYRRIVSADDLQTNNDEYKVRNGGDNSLPNGVAKTEAEKEEFIEQFKDFLPTLSVKFTAGLPEEEIEEDPEDDKQYVGLRFESVDIPQGAKIVRANIEFTSSTDASTTTVLSVKIEDTANAASFTEVDGDISNRSTTSKEVIWKPTSWKEGVTYTTPVSTSTTPDLSVLLQDIVNKSDWCGGQGGLAFIISASGGANPLRNAKSYDNRPNFAPRLNVEFDSKQINGDGCVWQNWTGQVSASEDDAEEKTGITKYVYTNSPILELGTRSKSGDDPRLVGFRFKNVPISQGAEIVKAHLILTSRNGGKDRPGGTLHISGEKSPNPTAFIRGPESDLNNTKRPKTSMILWKPEEESWEKNMRYQSPDIKSVIQEIVQQPEWNVYNNLALFIDGAGRYDVASFDTGPSSAPILRIQVKGMLGEDGEGSFMTVRRRLTRIVQEMEIPKSRTAIVDSLYESSRYFLSGAEGYNKEYEVEYGKDRHGEREYLVSHPGSYQKGTGTVEGIDKTECNVNIDPLNKACAGEYIDGTAIYQSPIETLCQTNHLVLLTDGLATRLSVVNNKSNKDSTDKIQPFIRELGGSGICVDGYTDPTTDSDDEIKVRTNETCGIDLADALFETGETIRPSITVHTIGFQLGKGWQSVYQVNNRLVYEQDGTYYYYKDNNLSSPQDTTVDDPVVDKADLDKLQRSGNYIENSNMTQKNKEAVKYLCRMASPKSVPGYDSEHPCPDKNFYLANTVEDLEVAFTQITTEAVDSTVNSSLVITKMFASPSVSISRFNNLQHDDKVYYALFESDNKPLWDGNVKKYKMEGGVLMGENDQPAVTGDGKIAPEAQSFWSGSPDGDVVTKGGAGGNLDSSRTILTYLGEAPPALRAPIALTDYEMNLLSSGDQKLILAEALLGDEIEDELTEEQQTQFEELKDWIIKENRNTWQFADPLHSSPKVITYGGTEEEPEAVVFVGTNDGLIHALDAESGVEKWAFLPKEMLPMQDRMMRENITNANDRERFYGVDGPSTFWTNLGADKTSVESENGDFVKMFTGMRRGGRNIYALDVTEPDEPKLMWIIKGGEGELTQLGQTWSSPTPTKVDPIYCKDVPSGTACIVLLFGGGYDAEQDESINSNTVDMGNAVYMVHANTGKLLWWASNQLEADLRLTGMIYPIPSDLTLADANEDGYTDRIYAGDVGGQVWRIDLNPNDGERGGRLLQVSAPISDIGDSNTNAKRAFFYAPAVTKLKGTHKNIVAIVSGTRPHPLPKEGLFDAHDQFYAFADPIDEAGSNWDDFSGGEPQLDPSSDFTDVSDLRGDNKVNIKQDDDSKQGWYLSLCEDADGCDSSGPWVGEKGFSAAYVVDETVFFTTYMPPGPPKVTTTETKDACSTIIETVTEEPDFGYSRLYKLNLLTGGPINPPPEDGDGEGRDNSKGGAIDKTQEGTPGISVPVNGPDGKIRIIFGFSMPVVGTQSLQRVFWTQVEE
ncbi:type IV pilin biogenesis protein [Beggiatoa sp. PS]|nr:type IV pilin biogenesis protein [Beggiatoa sp. PS]